MDNIYKLKVNDNPPITLTEKDTKDLDIVVKGPDTFHILKKNKSYHVNFLSCDFEKKHYKVEVNHRIYDVNIDNSLDVLIEQIGIDIHATSNIMELLAPMPGLILDIVVSAGQQVKENEPLIILEAMKMENAVLSPRDGIIKDIVVNQGDAVDKNQLLIVFEE
ncbi:MAG: acetyl-CoA carboxylase biotin carboxyl carrier protein subunit [Flavobacteriia bacterium]|nr:MAG: acetyl-CoA carboxylase biotin carboxyl carrier protein subunit [Flavobacteriia bacterium]